MGHDHKEVTFPDVISQCPNEGRRDFKFPQGVDQSNLVPPGTGQKRIPPCLHQVTAGGIRVTADQDRRFQQSVMFRDAVTAQETFLALQRCPGIFLF